MIEKVNAVTVKVLDEKPEHLRRFTAAILKASRHFADNEEAWVTAMTKRRPDVDRKDAADLWAGFKTAWAVNGLMNLEAYKKTARFFLPERNVGKSAENRSRRIGLKPALLTTCSRISASTENLIRPAARCARRR